MLWDSKEKVLDCSGISEVDEDAVHNTRFNQPGHSTRALWHHFTSLFQLFFNTSTQKHKY